MKNNRHIIYTRIFFIFIGIAAAILISEVSLRISGKYDFDKMVFTRDYTGGKHVFHAKYFRPSKYFGSELIPNADKTINSFGMRDREYTLEKPEGKKRILVLGDSLTCFAHWTDYLEDKLNSQEDRYEVLNCAVNGWNLYNYYLYLRQKGLRFKPDLVLVGFCLNDIIGWNMFETVFIDKHNHRTTFYCLKKSSEEGSFSDILRINPYLFYRSYLYRFLVSKYLIRKRYKIKGSRVDMLKEMKNMADGRLLAVVFPYIKHWKDYSKREKNDYYGTVGRVKKAGIKYKSLLRRVDGFDYPEKFRASREDKLHFNDEGNKVIAESVYAWLKQEGF